MRKASLACNYKEIGVLTPRLRMFRQKRGGVSVERGHGVVAGASQKGGLTECNMWRMWRMHRILTENVNSLIHLML